MDFLPWDAFYGFLAASNFRGVLDLFPGFLVNFSVS